MPRYNPGGDETLRSNKAIGESPADVVTDGGTVDPFGDSERHIYFSREEYARFRIGVPIERETDGVELTIFPPQYDERDFWIPLEYQHRFEKIGDVDPPRGFQDEARYYREWLEVVREADPGSTIILDEAGGIAYQVDVDRDEEDSDQ